MDGQRSTKDEGQQSSKLIGPVTPYSGPAGGPAAAGGGGGTESAEPSALSQLSETVGSLDPLAAMEKSMQDTVR